MQHEDGRERHLKSAGRKRGAGGCEPLDDRAYPGLQRERTREHEDVEAGVDPARHRQYCTGLRLSYRERTDAVLKVRFDFVLDRV